MTQRIDAARTPISQRGAMRAASPGKADPAGRARRKLNGCAVAFYKQKPFRGQKKELENARCAGSGSGSGVLESPGDGV